MDFNWGELSDIVLRWFHVIAGIMWIGNSLLFNWLDRNLVKEQARAEQNPLTDGVIWMVHSGGFYEVEKKQLAPNQLPKILHWFKWQNFLTWVSGIFLLVVVYYLEGSFLVDPAVSDISVADARLLGIGLLVGGWVVYDVLWRTVGPRAPAVATVVSFALLGGAAMLLIHFLSGRAAYIHLGVLMGTVMTGNVWFVILPSQRALLRATKAGEPQDVALGKKAKQRSIHNNYMTFPLIFIMVSNHFPSTYGNKLNWVILGVVLVTGAAIRHFMNIRFGFRAWVPALAVTSALGLGALAFLTAKRSAAGSDVAIDAAKLPHDFTAVNEIMGRRCRTCHSALSSDETWQTPPQGVVFDTPAQIKNMVPKIRERVVVLKNMPLNNKTRITEEERAVLGAWIADGAPIPDEAKAATSR